MIGGDLTQREKTRKIITQVVNSLTSKMEIGGPMASLYLLEILIIIPVTNLFLFTGGDTLMKCCALGRMKKLRMIHLT